MTVLLGRAALLKVKEQLASARRHVYLMEESCAEKVRQTAHAQSGIPYIYTQVLSLLL